MLCYSDLEPYTEYSTCVAAFTHLVTNGKGPCSENITVATKQAGNSLCIYIYIYLYITSLCCADNDNVYSSNICKSCKNYDCKSHDLSLPLQLILHIYWLADTIISNSFTHRHSYF